jgi:flagellar biosynthesis/type III secretory pathway M-ring protein FliF/YscJ
MATGQLTSPTQRMLEAWESLSVSVRIAAMLMLVGAMAAAGLALSGNSRAVDRAMSPLMGGYEFSLESRESAIKAFQEGKLTGYTLVGNKIMVPVGSEVEYLAALASSKTGLPGNTDDAIDRYIEEQRSWWASTAESERLFRVAEERRLARVIETFPEIDHASVLVSDLPPRGTLRARSAQGTAAVKVSTNDGKPLHPRRVEQIKTLVAGKFRDIASPDRVEVVSDALGSGGSAGTGGPDPALLSEGAGQYLMTKAAFSMQIENKIRELFADLKGLTVAVNAELDPRHSRIERITKRDKGPVKRESSDTSNSESASGGGAAAGGEPGTRTNVDAPGAVPNQGAQASGGGANPSTQTSETSEKEYDNGQTLTDHSFVDFEPVKVGVVVRYRVPPAAGAAGATPGTNESAGPDPQKVRAMIATLGYPGVSVESVSVEPYEGDEPEAIAEPSPSYLSTMTQILPSIVLAILGIFAIIVAVIVANRAPVPKLAKEFESAREAEAARAADEVQAKADVERSAEAAAFEQTQQQINKLVKENPEMAASVIRRWVQESL